MATDLKAAAQERFGEAQKSVIEMSRRIYANPELGFEEEKASAWLCEYPDADKAFIDGALAMAWNCIDMAGDAG